MGNPKKQKSCLSSELKDIFVKTISAIEKSEYHLAREYLKKAFLIDMECHEIFNLLGICYEFEGDLFKASRFYRVAYYLNQSFKAPMENLERTCAFGGTTNLNVNWGLKEMEG